MECPPRTIATPTQIVAPRPPGRERPSAEAVWSPATNGMIIDRPGNEFLQFHESPPHRWNWLFDLFCAGNRAISDIRHSNLHYATAVEAAPRRTKLQSGYCARGERHCEKSPTPEEFCPVRQATPRPDQRGTAGSAAPSAE